MEAGNRCFDMRVPEEINRRIVDHTADINLTYSSIAREYLLREGLKPEMVIKSGSPMNEILTYYRNRIDTSEVLERLNIECKKYFMVSMLREENIDSDFNFSRFIALLNALAERYDYPIIVSTHPRTQSKINEVGANFHSSVRLMNPLGFFDYIATNGIKGGSFR